MGEMREFDTRFALMGQAANDAQRHMNVLEACQAECMIVARNLLWILAHRDDPDCSADTKAYLRTLCELELSDEDLPEQVVRVYYTPLVAFCAHDEEAFTETLQADALGVCEEVVLSSAEFLEQNPAPLPGQSAPSHAERRRTFKVVSNNS